MLPERIELSTSPLPRETGQATLVLCRRLGGNPISPVSDTRSNRSDLGRRTSCCSSAVFHLTRSRTSFVPSVSRSDRFCGRCRMAESAAAGGGRFVFNLKSSTAIQNWRPVSGRRRMTASRGWHFWRLAAILATGLGRRRRIGECHRKCHAARRLDQYSGLDRSDDGFYAPLAGLKLHGARLYLGLIHNMAGFAPRFATARNSSPILAWRRRAVSDGTRRSELPTILQDHLTALKLAAPMQDV